VPNHADAQVLQVLRRQVGQDLLADLILAECRFILFEAKLPQPSSDIHGGAPVASAACSPRRDSLSRRMTGLGHSRLKRPSQAAIQCPLYSRWQPRLRGAATGREGPQADISSILTVRTLGRCKPVAQSLTEVAVPDAG
jgi:hypothetical protein